MHLADDLVQLVADHVEEVPVGAQHSTRGVELDDRLHPVDRGQLAMELGLLFLCRCDVGRELDHSDRSAGVVEDRVVSGVQPDWAARLCQAQVHVLLDLPRSQTLPHRSIARTVDHFRRAENAVVLA
jgi:hypothetical protein